MKPLAFSQPVALSLLLAAAFASAHVEDLCVARPGNSATSGVYNFYSAATKLNCGYGQINNTCVTAVMAQSQNTFNDTSICRGSVHFNSVFFTAAALGFSQDVAHFLSAFSQSIDFVQYRAIDSCGRDMNARFWTPPLRGFLRTAIQYGGTNRHMGIPFVGYSDQAPPMLQALNGTSWPMMQAMKTYKGGSAAGCDSKAFKGQFSDYVTDCAGLRIDTSDTLYEGALSWGKRWAMNETNLLCNAGFTTINTKTRSPFTGTACATGGQKAVNTNELQQGPIPLGGQPMQFGEQVVHFECSPNCSASNYTVVQSSVVKVSKLASYLSQQAASRGTAKMSDGSVVPEVVARMGVYLHWVADRASHWYCGDAPASGVVIVPNRGSTTNYDAYVYADPSACNFMVHGETHFWEQGMNTTMAPGTYAALQGIYLTLLDFRNKFRSSKPGWFTNATTVLSEAEVVGNYAAPGILFRINGIKDGAARFAALVKELKDRKLPAMPGFEAMCGKRRRW